MNLRIKMGCLPGDVSKGLKIAMVEGKLPKGHSCFGKPAKSYKKCVRMKEKAVLKERARKVIEDALD